MVAAENNGNNKIIQAENSNMVDLVS